MKLLPVSLLVIILTISIAVPTTLGGEICKQGINRNVPQKSGDGKCYAFFKDEDEKYNKAHSICQENGGSLAMPKTKAINDVLAKEITKLNLGDDKRFWIGLNDKEDENVFLWEDGTRFDKDIFSSWNSDDEGPRGGAIQHSAEDCVGIDKFGKWHDFICKYFFLQREMPFVCEFDLPTTTTTTTTPTTMTTTRPTTTPFPDTGDTTASPTPTTSSPSPAPTATTPLPTPESLNVVTTTGCPELKCTKDCGLVGYKTIPATGCFLCECDD